MHESISIRDKEVGRVVDGVYITYRDETRHLMKMFGGYGISDTLLKSLKAKGVTHIHIKTKQGHDYIFKIDKYLNSNKKYRLGNDLQRFVSIDYLYNPNTKNKLTNYI